MKFTDQNILEFSAFLSPVQYASGEMFGKSSGFIFAGEQFSHTRLSSSVRVGRRHTPPS
jgi:hypothetical protein